MTKDEIEKVAKMLGAMFQCFPQSALADPDLQVHGYIKAVKDFDVRDVITACQRFIQGDVKGHNNAFCPSSAQLCAEVRERRTMREIAERSGDKVVPMVKLPANHFQNKWNQEGKV